jgi:hypothetical protein
MWHCSSSPHATSRSYPRSLIHSFSTQTLDRAAHCCSNLELSFLVSMLQLTGCPPQAFSRTSAGLCNQSHSRLSLLSSTLCRHLVTITICLVQLSLCLWSSFCCPTDHVTLLLSLYSPFGAATVISVSLKLSSRSHLVAVYPCCRRLYSRHESQHPSLAGAQPLERAYCHESRYVSFGLNL